MTIIDAYVIMIQAGKRTLEQVPERYRAEVESLLGA